MKNLNLPLMSDNIDEDDNDYDIEDLIVFKTLYNYTLLTHEEIACNDLLFTSDPGLSGPPLLSIEDNKLYLQLYYA